MKKQLITKTERVDDIPLLLAQMRKMRLAELIDEQFPAGGAWQASWVKPPGAAILET
jgi:hypothetical protein